MNVRGMKIALWTAALTGLSLQVPAQKPATAGNRDPARATVYFFRYTEWHGNMLEPSVYCDGVQLARLDNGRYFAIELEPGKHACHSNHKESRVELDLKAGEIYYVRMEMEMGMWKTKGRLVPIGQTRAAMELRSVSPLSSEKVKDKKRVRLDLPPPESPSNIPQS